jgi:Ser/Thr protein kinase RdoA (MazF antagonist)
MTDDDNVPALYRELLRAACEHAGLGSVSAHLIKLTNNAVFSLAHDPYVVRIAGSDVIGAQADKTIAFAHWLAANDVPTIVPLETVTQPFDVDGHAVTIWHRVETTGAKPTVGDLAGILRRLHASTGDGLGLPAWDQIGSIRDRLAGQDVLTNDQAHFLTDQIDELAEAITQVEYLLPAGPIHGDAHTGSLIAGLGGVVICDFDTAAHGPREWDLIPLAANTARFAELTDEQDQMAAAYGLDIRDWEHYATMRRIRELQVLVAPLPILADDPGVRDQWEIRYDSLRTGDTEAIWTPWSKVDLAAKKKP